MKNSTKMPTYHELMNPLLQALHQLGCSGSIEEIAQKVAELSDLPEEILNVPHNPEKSSQTEIEYRLAWARTYLKKYGILDNSDRGIWIIVPEKREVTKVDPQEVIKTVRAEIKKQKELVQNHLKCNSVHQTEKAMAFFPLTLFCIKLSTCQFHLGFFGR